ncbi:hypothetical protein DUNSADRAFT_1466 [Dunaliella salina]|uniref:Encoded protein n=1 Tax=Dunaliella salina TaxID=3046 RepID=A0ABQ7GX14_DUNSA|nr:hypothetical protein DUNSADRAFT_1466 [Dunaliella salina]|eukprot:KAF5839153.1 hypothetical protein DUNSADRAFT_1466 [Dunaliella salina]
MFHLAGNPVGMPPTTSASNRSSLSESQPQLPPTLEMPRAPPPLLPRFFGSAPSPSTLLQREKAVQDVAEKTGLSTPLPLDPYAPLQQQQLEQQQEQQHKTRLRRLSEFLRAPLPAGGMGVGVGGGTAALHSAKRSPGARASGVAHQPLMRSYACETPSTTEFPYAPARGLSRASGMSSSMGHYSFSTGNLQARALATHHAPIEPWHAQQAGPQHAQQAEPWQTQQAGHAWQHTATQRAAVQVQGVPGQDVSDHASEELLSGSVALGLLGSAAQPKMLRCLHLNFKSSSKLQMSQRSAPLTQDENEAADILFSMSSTGFAQQSKEPRGSIAYEPLEGCTPPQGTPSKHPLGAAPITIGSTPEIVPQPEARCVVGVVFTECFVCTEPH